MWGRASGSYTTFPTRGSLVCPAETFAAGFSLQSHRGALLGQPSLPIPPPVHHKSTNIPLNPARSPCRGCTQQTQVCGEVTLSLSLGKGLSLVFPEGESGSSSPADSSRTSRAENVWQHKTSFKRPAVDNPEFSCSSPRLAISRGKKTIFNALPAQHCKSAAALI